MRTQVSNLGTGVDQWLWSAASMASALVVVVLGFNLRCECNLLSLYQLEGEVSVQAVLCCVREE